MFTRETIIFLKVTFTDGTITKCKKGEKGRFECFGSSLVSLSSPLFVFVFLLLSLNVCCAWNEVLRTKIASYLSMSLHRPFIAPRSTRTKRQDSQTQSEKDKDVSSPMSTGIANHDRQGYDQTPISDWGVSDDEEDLVPIERLIATDKQQVLQLSKDEAEGQEIFVKGHVNLGKIVAKFFESVLHVGTVTEVIPRRSDFYYKVTYGDGDQEDMDEKELLYAMELRQKKDDGLEISPEAGGDAELSGLSEEGSVYDSEDDNKAMKESKRKRKISTQKGKDSHKKKRTSKTKWAVCPESAANIGGLASMLGKSMSRYKKH